MSAMREAMSQQESALRRVLADRRPVGPAAVCLQNRRVLLVGTGTSWHAANQGAWLLRLAGVEAWPVAAADVVGGGPTPRPGDALVLLSHKGTKTYTSQVLQQAREDGLPIVVISRVGSPDADLDTVPQEVSSAFTSSHLCALMRLAQLATELGAPLGRLEAVPDAVGAELAAGPTAVGPPERLLELVGTGINAWTASEGALKTRETSYLACSGGNAEHFLHGPSVALGEQDTLVCLDGGGTQAGRLDDIRTIVAAQGSHVHYFERRELGEPLSIFPLTVIVQKIAAEAAEAKGTNPDSFGRDLPGRVQAWSQVAL